MNTAQQIEHASGSTAPVYASVQRWTEISGLSRSGTYRALGAGHLRAIKVGVKTLVDVPHGLAWLNAQPTAKFGHGAN
jgi:hypothetical protein